MVSDFLGGGGADLGKAVLELFTDNSGLNKGLDQGESRAKAFGKNVAKFAAGGALAVTGIGIAAGKMAMDFEGAMSEVRTLMPGITDEAFAPLREGILDISKDFGIATNEAVPALYQAISAGVPKENVMSFMEVASKAAIGGVTDLETAVDGISSVVNAYGEDTIDAGKASDVMFTAVRLGKTDFDQLSRSLFNVIPTASSLGISFEEVAAQLSVITAQGTPTSVATTQLRQVFVETTKDGSKLAAAIEDMAGKSMVQLLEEGSSVTEVLNDLRGSMSDEEFRNLFGSVEALNGALGITGPNAEATMSAMEQMNGAAGATNEAFETVSDTAQFKFGKAFNRIKVAMIEFGSVILPIAVKGLEAIFAVGEKLAPIMQGLAKTLQGFFSGDAHKMLGGLAQMGFDSGKIALFTEWLTKAREKLGNIVNTIRTDVLPVLAEFAAKVQEGVVKVLGAISTTITNDILPKLQSFADFFTIHIVPAAQSLGGTLQTTVVPMLTALGSWLKDHKDVMVAFGVAWAAFTLTTQTFAAIKGVQSIFQAIALGIKSSNLALATPPGIAILLAAIATAIFLIWQNWDEIWPKLQAGWDLMKSVAVDVKDAVVGAFSAVVDWLRDKFFAFMDSKFVWLAGLLGPMGFILIAYKFRDEIKGVFTTVADWIRDKIDLIGTFIDKLRVWFVGLPTDIKNGFVALVDIITQPFRDGFNILIGIINKFIDGVNAIPDFTVGGFLGIPETTVGIPELPRIPKMASGGWVPGRLGEPRMIEAHGGEYVVPASRASSTTHMPIYLGDTKLADLWIEGQVLNKRMRTV